MQGRFFVVTNINGQLVPFYKSSAGTSGKTQGAWYPFFGYTGAWLVKGGIDKATSKMSYSSEIDRVTNLLNENLVFPDKYINRVTNTVKDTDGNTMFDFNDFFKVNRLWKITDDFSTGTKADYSIKGLKENTRSESGAVALITGLNTTELDSSDTPKENSEWLNLISKNAKLVSLGANTKAEGTNARGTTYKGITTKQRNGSKLTKYSEFNSDGKIIPNGGRIMTPAEFIKEFNIEQWEQDILKDATEIKIYEINSYDWGYPIGYMYQDSIDALVSYPDSYLPSRQRSFLGRNNIEIRRLEEINDKEKIYEQSLSRNTKNPNRNILKEDKIFTKSGKISEVGFRKVDKTSDSSFVFRYNANIDEINAKYTEAQVALEQSTETIDELRADTKADINLISTPVSKIVEELSRLKTLNEKLDWLKNNNLLSPININGKEYNTIDYSDRVMVLMKVGKYNIPFYISTGQAGFFPVSK